MDDILVKIGNSDSWPSIKNAANLEVLDVIGRESFALETLSGKISATMVFHQIIESMCKHLIESCNFCIELSLYPFEINTSKIKDDKMLGVYIDILDKSIVFDKKNDYIEKIKEFNIIRNGIVHKMTNTNIDKFENDLNRILLLFNNIYELYIVIQDDFRLIFKDFYKDKFIDLI